MKAKARISGNQWNGIAAAWEIGINLSKTNPEMADEYREGKSLSEIALKYRDVILTESVGVSAVRHALDRLLSYDEMRKLEIQHRQKNGRNRALSFTAESQRAAGRASALSKEMALYDGELMETELGVMTEKEYIMTLKNSGKYEFRGGWKKIAEKINSIFGNSRDNESLPSKYSRWKETS